MNKPAAALGTLCVLALLATGCRREAPQPATPEPAAVDAPPARPAEAMLTDVMETDPRYIIGITYPPAATRHPGLAAELQRYAETARTEVLEAVANSQGAPMPAPYDLSLLFETVVETPTIVAISADGSSYTGGAHGNPLVARFVWLPETGRLLRVTDLVPSPEGWQEISAFVREQLHAALSQRVDADALPPAERREVMLSAGKMIDEGSQADPADFAQFEPVVDRAGQIVALRFVFPPYQVGPYADGTQSVDVPASVLLPHVAAEYQPLFAQGGATG